MKLNQYIDHTILKPAATAADVEAICREAVEYEFASVCVNTCHVRLVSRLLSGSPVKTCVVVGFPLGAPKPRPLRQSTRLATAPRRWIWSSM